MKPFFIIFIFFYLIHISYSNIITTENKFFKIETNNNEYKLYDISKNLNEKNFLSIQILLCDSTSFNSQFSIENENIEIYTTDLISSRNLIINITEYKNKKLKIRATSPKMYFQYQFVNNSSNFFPLGLIKNTFSNLEKNSINFYMSPIVNNTKSTYELFFSKNNLVYRCDKLEFSLNNKPIAIQKIKGINYFNLNFQYLLYDENEKNIKGYVFIKGNNVDDLNFVYFYDSNEVTLHFKKENKEDNNNNNLFSFFLIFIICIICVLLIIFFLKKYKNLFRERNNNFVKIDTIF